MEKMPARYLLPFILAAPLLQGVMDARLLAFFSVLAAALLSLRLWRGKEAVLTPSAACLLAVALFSALAVYLSPVRHAVYHEWLALAAGLCLFFLAKGQSVKDRAFTDAGIRAVSWALAAVALYQAFILKSEDVSSTLVNPNALAFFVLLAGPLAVARGDFVLTAVLALVFFLTGSLGALLALIAAAAFMAVIALRRSGDRRALVLLAVLAAAAVLTLTQSDFISAANRFSWWRSAAAMFADSPVFGHGHSAFTWLYPLYGSPAAAEGSVYAHNHYLEFAAENGLPAALAWFSLLGMALAGARRLALFGLLAALLHSALDFGLSLPANFWLFCVLAGRELPAAEKPFFRGDGRPAAVLAGLLAAAAAFSSLTPASYEKETGTALARLREGADQAALQSLRRASALPYGRGETEETSGRLRYSISRRTGSREDLFLAAVDLEKALLKMPSRYSSASALRALYAGAGLPGLAEHERFGRRGEP